MNPIGKWSQARVSSPLLSGLMFAFIWMIAGTIVTSLLLFATDMQESKLSAYSFIIHGIAVFFGGIVSGKRSGNKGWYHGGMLGVLYSLLVLIVGFLALDAGFSKATPMLVTLCFLLGALGGMLGVNMKK
mgnify:CR=1 FL=1|jgi:putative membrane protein (TIGR04086 family)